MNMNGEQGGDEHTVGHPKPRIVAGFGRSGTTWIQDVLAASNNLRPVFEPLHPQHSRGAEPFAHRYYGAEDTDTKLRQLLECHFSGNCRSLWTDYRIISRSLFPHRGALTSIDGAKHLVRTYLRAKDKFLSLRHYHQHDERIVKFIRANMMLSWIERQFGARIVFIIRHPAAVVLSQMRAAHYWNPYKYIARYQQDEMLRGALEGHIEELLFRKHDRVEAYALAWCIENSVALRQCKQSNIPVVFYEDLIRRGAPEWQRILEALNLKIMPDDGLIAQPSQQAWGDRAESAELVRKFSYWTESMNQDILNRIQAMLDATHMSVYKTSEVLPIADA